MLHKRVWAVAFVLLLMNSLLGLTLNNHTFTANGLGFSIEPVLIYYQNINTLPHTERATFSPDTQGSSSSQLMSSYTSDVADFVIQATDYSEYYPGGWLVKLCVTYHQHTMVKRLQVKLNCLQPVTYYYGIKSCADSNATLNKNLTPFSSRVIRAKYNDNNVWLAGSFYSNKANIEYISGDSLSCYDNRCHSCPMQYLHENEWDWKTYEQGDREEYFFVLFEKPLPNFDLSNYPWNYDAALCITNDADSESSTILPSTFFGSTSTTSDYYLTKGLIARNIPVTNTVFPSNWRWLRNIWRTIYNSGSSIAYHTYCPTADDMDSLAYWMPRLYEQFHANLWIDHSMGTNPEDIANEGYNPDSPYYVMDLLRQNHIKYAWVGYNRVNNYNAFTDFRQLPHRCFSIDPEGQLLFFERWRMDCWIVLQQPEISFASQITSENLDRLLSENGLAIVYTHFSMGPGANNNRVPFWEDDPSGNGRRIRAEADSTLCMLAGYRDQGLWLATAETIFDRLMAIDSLRVSSIRKVGNNCLLTLTNYSHFAVDDLAGDTDNGMHNLGTLRPNQNMVITIYDFYNHETQAHDVTIDNVSVYCKGDKIVISDEDPQRLNGYNPSVYNIRGQKQHLGFERSENQISISMRGQPSGLYFVKTKGQVNKVMYVK